MNVSADFDDLLSRLKEGERRALARLISRVENGEYVEEVRSHLAAHQPGHSLVVGMTGSPGAGKSSLTAALVKHFSPLRSISCGLGDGSCQSLYRRCTAG